MVDEGADQKKPAEEPDLLHALAREEAAVQIQALHRGHASRRKLDERLKIKKMQKARQKEQEEQEEQVLQLWRQGLPAVQLLSKLKVLAQEQEEQNDVPNMVLPPEPAPLFAGGAAVGP